MQMILIGMYSNRSHAILTYFFYCIIMIFSFINKMILFPILLCIASVISCNSFLVQYWKRLSIFLLSFPFGFTRPSFTGMGTTQLVPCPHVTCQAGHRVFFHGTAQHDTLNKWDRLGLTLSTLGREINGPCQAGMPYLTPLDSSCIWFMLNLVLKLCCLG